MPPEVQKSIARLVDYFEREEETDFRTGLPREAMEIYPDVVPVFPSQEYIQKEVYRVQDWLDTLREQQRIDLFSSVAGGKSK